MAFGFPPKYVRDVNLGDLDKEHFLLIAIESASRLNWDVRFIHDTGFIAYTKFSWRSWSEEVAFIIDNNIANIKSVCTGSQFVDWGKNKKNIKALIAMIEEVKVNFTQEDFEAKLVEIREEYSFEEDEDEQKNEINDYNQKQYRILYLFSTFDKFNEKSDGQGSFMCDFPKT